MLETSPVLLCERLATGELCAIDRFIGQAPDGKSISTRYWRLCKEISVARMTGSRMEVRRQHAQVPDA
jgi:hypothetical protein